MRRLIYLLITIIYLPAANLLAQEQLGIRTSNYGGVNSLLLNPANSQTMPFAWDANLLEAGLFFENNYAFVENFRLLDALKMPDNVELRPLLEEDNATPPAGSLIMDFYRIDANGTSHAGFLTSVMGPSLALRVGEAHTVGLFTRARAFLNTFEIPSSLGYYEYNNQPFETAIEIDPASGSALAWSEIGLNYAYHGLTSNGELSFGASLKFLQGYEAVYIRNNSYFELTQLRDNRLQGTAVDFNYGFASTGLDSDEWSLQRNGGGVGVDLGVVYTFTDDADLPYRWKLGASILDLGAVRFNKSAQKHAIRTADLREMSLDEYNQFTDAGDLDSILQVFSRQILQDPDASLVRDVFAMQLPTALSIQADVALLPSLFVNATIVQAVPVSRISIRRNSIAALTPRIESRWLELAVPVSLLDWTHFRVGASARLGFLYFGTEDFSSIFQQQESFDSTDFYIAIKLNPFQLGNGGGSKGKSARLRGKGKGDVKCPVW